MEYLWVVLVIFLAVLGLIVWAIRDHMENGSAAEQSTLNDDDEMWL
tara:strand:- start:41423 stop:41560 length:138 start_codon:yes stop_codon:yes gene_type:complete